MGIIETNIKLFYLFYYCLNYFTLLYVTKVYYYTYYKEWIVMEWGISIIIKLTRLKPQCH